MKIKNGNGFSLLLTDRGEVYSWGKNKLGQLGIGTTDKYYHTPTKLKFILDIPIRYISAGWDHAAAIDFDYKVDTCSPTIIENLTEKKVEKIYCKNIRKFAITQNGEVYSWGK